MNHLQLLDWRRRVSNLYGELRARPNSSETAGWFRAERDRLFREHPQSPLPADERSGFQSLSYWPFDPRGRVEARLVPASPESSSEPRPPLTNGEALLLPIGQLEFELLGQPSRLTALWVEGYGGGIFVPFRDATCGTETYGGGRYLLDSIKSADLGSSDTDNTVTLDFNYAYHPSCAYDPIWPCPLAPPENWLTQGIRLGERLSSVEEAPR